MNDLILVTGSEGLVGSRFLEISESKNNFHTPTQIEMDITKPSEIKAILASYDFKAIIHFAAYTDVSAAEKERAIKYLKAKAFSLFERASCIEKNWTNNVLSELGEKEFQLNLF